MIRHASFCPAFVTTTALVAISADAQAQTPPQTTEIERLRATVERLEARLATVEAELANRPESEAPREPVVAAVSAASAATPPTGTVVPTPPLQSVKTRPSGPSLPVGTAAVYLVGGPNALPDGGFRIGGTVFRVTGFIKGDTMFSRYSDGERPSNFLGRDLAFSHSVPVGGPGSGLLFDASAKQSRIAVQTTTPVGAYAISTLIEADFQVAPGTQGNERALNAYNLGLRRAVLGYRDFAVGQDWSNFQYVAALPESADFLGVTEGTVFARQMLVRYEQPIGGNMRVSISIENPETVTNTPQNVALADHDDDPLPDLTGQLFWSRGGTSLSLTGVARHMRVNPGAGALRGDAFGYGLSFAGVLSIPGTRDDLRFMLSGGRGIGRYIGVNLAPDAIYDSAVGSLTPVPLIAGFAAYRHNWGNSFRSTLMGSFQSIDNPDFASPLSNRTIWSIAANIFVTPLPRLDVGVEFRHTEREIESRASGALDRLQFTIKQGF